MDRSPDVPRSHAILTDSSQGDWHPQYPTKELTNLLLGPFVSAANPIWSIVPGGDVTAQVNRMFMDPTVLDGSTIIFKPGTYYFSGPVVCNRNLSIYAVGVTWNFNGMTFASVDDVAFTFGNSFTSGKIFKQSVVGLEIQRDRAGSLVSDAIGSGFYWYAIYECNITSCRADGFERGHRFSGAYTVENGEQGFAYNILNNLRSENCRFGFYLEPGNQTGAGPSGWCNDNNWLGGRIGHGFTAVTNSKDSCTALYIETKFTGGHDCNNNRFSGVSMENFWGRKVYCESLYNAFLYCRYENPWGQAANPNASAVNFEGQNYRFAAFSPYRGQLVKTTVLTNGGTWPYTVTQTTEAYNISIPTDVAARTIKLPASPASYNAYRIFDGNNNAAVNNITIDGNGHNIVGAATSVINTNGGELSIYYSPSGAGSPQWRVDASPTTSVDIECATIIAGEGGSNDFVEGYDLGNCVVKFPLSAFNTIRTINELSLDVNSMIRARSISLGNTQQGLYSQSMIRGNGATAGMTFVNTTGSTTDALAVNTANELDTRLTLRPTADGSQYLGAMAARDGTGVGTERTWWAMRNAAPYPWCSLTGFAAVDSAGAGTGFYVGFKAPALAASLLYTMPPAPIAGLVLSTDGAGVLSWIAGGGATGATGAPGPPGLDGADGTDGAVGPQGNTGATGPAGADGLASTVAGPPGIDGLDGDVGPQGPPGKGASFLTFETTIGAPASQGKFFFIDSNVQRSNTVMMWQAPGPYTGKGTRADEASFAPVTVIAVETLTDGGFVYWKAAETHAVEDWNTPPLNPSATVPYPAFVRPLKRVGKVGGNIRFNYLVF